MLDGISFSIRAGEIVGIAGLMGSGRTELALRSLVFLNGKKSGTVRLRGKEHILHPLPTQSARAWEWCRRTEKRLGLFLDKAW